jgi:4-aminobutyrate aminotransferase-like enzyme
MLAELRAFSEEFPFVGHVDGRGLLLGIRLVRDKKTRKPLARRATRRIFAECLQRGLLTMAYTANFRIQPALTIDLATARNGLAVLREVFLHVQKARLWELE